MLDAAVVPERDVIDAPAPPHRKLRLCHVRKQETEQRLAFPWLKFIDMRRESFVDEQPFAPADRVGAHDRMVDGRMLGHGTFVARLEFGVVLPAFGRERLRHRMLSRQSLQKTAHRFGQRIIGSGAARPQRVAAQWRKALGSQNPGERRRLTERDVGMPIVVIGQKALMRIDQHDLGKFRQHRIDRVDVQRSEFCREATLSLRSDRLVAKEQNLVFHQDFAETIDHVLRQVLRDIDPMHDGAEGSRQACDFNGHA